MKKIYLFCTKPVMLLTELPLIVLLTLSISFNGSANGLLKLYPLIIACSAIIIFIFVFFFRVISLSGEEIRMIGKFSSRDSAVIKKGRRLELGLCKKNRLSLELFEDDAILPALDFLKNDPDYKPAGLNLFHERAVFGKRALRKVLRYFEISDTDIEKIFSSDTYKCMTPVLMLTSRLENNMPHVCIEFTQTI